MAKPISDVLRDIRRGALVDEATEALASVVNAVTASGGSGKITIELSLKRAARGALVISDKVTVKLPKEEQTETLMFPTPEGSLVTEHPAQQKLPFVKVPEPEETPVRTVNAD